MTARNYLAHDCATSGFTGRGLTGRGLNVRGLTGCGLFGCAVHKLPRPAS
jgi:hypothetical protein